MVRDPRQQFVHSKVMVWVALDRAVSGAEQMGRDEPGFPIRRRTRDEVHRQVREKGFDARRNTFTQAYGYELLDVSTLMLPSVGFLPPDDPRMKGTVEAIGRELMEDGVVVRYLHATNAQDRCRSGKAQIVALLVSHHKPPATRVAILR